MTVQEEYPQGFHEVKFDRFEGLNALGIENCSRKVAIYFKLKRSMSDDAIIFHPSNQSPEEMQKLGQSIDMVIAGYLIGMV